MLRFVSTRSISRNGIQKPGYQANLLPFALLVLYLLLYILPLGIRPLAIPDEARYAEIPREMLSSGDWITPRLIGLRYFEKPPLGYWLNAVSIAALGENNFAARLPGALAAGMTTLFVYLFSLKIWRTRRIAMLAALIHMTTTEVQMVGTFSLLDNFLALFLCAGFYNYYMAIEKSESDANRRLNMILAGAAFGLAFLSKGFLGLVLPVIVLVPWLLILGDWRTLVFGSWWVVVAALLVVLPWAISIHLAEGDFWHYFFWIEHVKRFTADNAQHRAPIYYYLVWLPILVFPWLTYVPAVIRGLIQRVDAGHSMPETIWMLWFWVVIPLLFFSLSSGKLVTYILPCIPAFAILSAAGLVRLFETGPVKWFNAGALINVGFLILLLVLLLVAQSESFGLRAFSSGESAKAAALAAALLAGIVAGMVACHSSKTRIKLTASALVVIPALLVLPHVIPGEIQRNKYPELLLSQYIEELTDDTILISDTTLMHSVSWYFKRDDIFLIGRGEVRYGLGYPDARHRFIDTPERFRAIVDNNAGLHPILMACKNCPEPFVGQLPGNVQKQTSGPLKVWFIPVAEQP